MDLSSVINLELVETIENKKAPMEITVEKNLESSKPSEPFIENQA